MKKEYYRKIRKYIDGESKIVLERRLGQKFVFAKCLNGSWKAIPDGHLCAYNIDTSVPMFVGYAERFGSEDGVLNAGWRLTEEQTGYFTGVVCKTMREVVESTEVLGEDISWCLRRQGLA